MASPGGGTRQTAVATAAAASPDRIRIPSVDMEEHLFLEIRDRENLEIVTVLERRDVLGLVVGQGLKLTGAGLALGILVSLVLTRQLSSLLFGVSVYDPLTYAGVTVILVIVALLACYIPARRATRVDPLIALRYE